MSTSFGSYEMADKRDGAVATTSAADERPPSSNGSTLHIPEEEQLSSYPRAAQPPPLLLYTRVPALIVWAWFILSVLTWVFTCIIAKKPFLLVKDYAWPGFGEGKSVKVASHWVLAIRILTVICGMLILPVVSIVLAFAGGIHAVRKSPDLVLDREPGSGRRGWAGYTITDHATAFVQTFSFRSNFVRLGLALYAISAVIYPLQGFFVAKTTIQAATKEEFHAGPAASVPGLAYGNLGQIINQVRTQLLYIQPTQEQPHIWLEPGSPSCDLITPHSFGGVPYTDFGIVPPSSFYCLGSEQQTFVTTSLNSSTNTQSSLFFNTRLNSSASCELSAGNTMPDLCNDTTTGFHARYFAPETQLERELNDTGIPHGFGDFDFQVCSPGSFDHNYIQTTRNRQDLSELVYFYTSPAVSSYLADQTYPGINASTSGRTIKCTVNTTIGYFELPNMYNDGQYGPLLETWPSGKELEGAIQERQTAE
jgi:hypothetical protein